MLLKEITDLEPIMYSRLPDLPEIYHKGPKVGDRKPISNSEKLKRKIKNQNAKKARKRK